MKTDVVIVAAGRGSRFSSKRPKQYCLLGGQTILQQTVKAFSQHPSVANLIVVIAKADIHLFEEAFPKNPPQRVFGGETRSQSVFAGLMALQSQSSGLVLIHDGARPFVTANDITAVLSELEQTEACAPALAVIDAIKEVDIITGAVLKDANRDQIKRVQTPQGFHFNKLLAAYREIDLQKKYDDDLSIALQAELSCKIIAGNPGNFKITTPDDLQKAKQKMQDKPQICVTGTGYDVHQICPGNSISLCGITLNCDFSLKGHSDADVGLHAITDALLGAMALGDIGDHFPPTDKQWQGASSHIFLSRAAEQTNKHGGRVLHVDLTLICEQPKINPVKEQMRSKIAEILLLDITQVSVKATTTEQLGFTGRQEGIAALASVTVMKEFI